MEVPELQVRAQTLWVKLARRQAGSWQSFEFEAKTS
jgi:hypothetical protein